MISSILTLQLMYGTSSMHSTKPGSARDLSDHSGMRIRSTFVTSNVVTDGYQGQLPRLRDLGPSWSAWIKASPSGDIWTTSRLNVRKLLSHQKSTWHLDHSTQQKGQKNPVGPALTPNLQSPIAGSGGHLGYDALHRDSPWEPTNGGGNVIS